MPKYSKTKFDGYTHRFKVELFTNDNSYTVDIYSDSGDYQELYKFIALNKKNGLTEWKIFHRATKAQDELSSVLIDEVLNNL